jgi:hypothetical protein
MIWLYGIDQYHSLASYHENTRFNILAMAYAWAANYPAELCDEAAVTMAQSYIDGWMSFMGNQYGPKSFACQEAFIKLWRSSEYDLMRFTEGERTRIQKSIILTRDRSFPPELLETVEDKIGDIIRMRREGNISDEIWQAYGTKLVMAWVFSKIDAGKSEKAEVDDDMMRLEATQTADAKAMAASVNGNALSQVAWDSPLLKGLLEPMDPAAREPWKLMKDKTISRPHGKPWMSVDIFIKLLKGAPFQAHMHDLAGGLVDTLADTLSGLGLAGGAAGVLEDVTMEG